MKIPELKGLRSYFYRAAARAGILDLQEELRGAAMCGETRRVLALIEAGANVKAGDCEALRMAQLYGHKDTAAFLEERMGRDVQWGRRENDRPERRNG